MAVNTHIHSAQAAGPVLGPAAGAAQGFLPTEAVGGPTVLGLDHTPDLDDAPAPPTALTTVPALTALTGAVTAARRAGR
ncbi:hypothetical protein ACIO87_29690 [Streptomyces sp. NPDC087218]|uniref:hypothetical protein n=1 Tax=Streptomyces sp. NPDC087218 TaxID=3365769 RepID=UPI00381351F3